MPNDVEPVFELELKIRGLQKLTGGRLSEHAIADLVGISRNTLRDNFQKSQMSRQNQEKCADKYLFSLAWPEWSDPNVDARQTNRRDSVAAFLARIVAEKNKAARLTIEASSTGRYLDKHFVQFRLAEAESSELGELILMLSTYFSERGLEVFFEETQELLTVGLRYAELALELSQERNGASIELYPIKCRSSEGNFEAEVTGLTRLWLFHTIENDGAWMQGHRERNRAKDCVCRGLHPGDKLVAVMSARISDCVAKEQRHRAKRERSRKASGARMERVSVPSGSFERSSDVRKQLIRHLVKYATLGSAKAILGEQTLTVGKKS